MTVTQDYAANTRRTKSIITEALDAWKNGLNAMTTPLQAFPTTRSTFPQFDATGAVERQFTFFQKVVDVNHDYARQLVEVTNTLSGAVRQHIEGLNTVLLEQVQSVYEVTQDRVEQFEDTVREAADEAERLQREAREEAEQAEAHERQQARKAAREHYRNLSKNELSDEAAQRNLRKTGTIDELVDRLVEDDTNK